MRRFQNRSHVRQNVGELAKTHVLANVATPNEKFFGEPGGVSPRTERHADESGADALRLAKIISHTLLKGPLRCYRSITSASCCSLRSSVAFRRQATRRRRPWQPTCERLEDRCLLSVGDLVLTLTNPTPAVGDGFGSSVAAVGNNILVGVPNDDTNAVNSGAAYLIDGTTGALLLTFTNPTPAIGDFFGYSVAAVGNNILVVLMPTTQVP